LPTDIWLNINFPEVSDSVCSSTGVQICASRIYGANPLITRKDVETCDNDGGLPTERDVIETGGSHDSISVGHAHTKGDANADEHAVVLAKLASIVSCLPRHCFG